MHDSRLVANRLLELASERDEALTPMQLLKLAFIAHGWSLALYRRPLIREPVEAWHYGPIIPALYDSLRRYRGAPIAGRLKVPGYLDLRADDVVRQVFDRYGHLTGPALSRMTSAPGTPWADVYRHRGDFGQRIPDDLIADYYAGLMQGARLAVS